MKAITIIVTAGLLFIAFSCYAHRLNEYLIATSVAIEKDHLTLRMHLTAGELVAGRVLSTIDRNNDGVISDGEQTVYVNRLRNKLQLIIDGRIIRLQLHSFSFPAIADIRSGMGDIMVSFDAALTSSNKVHYLTFTNQLENKMAVYLVNCLVPVNPDISVVSQSRNYNQSHYKLIFKTNKED